MMRRVLLLIAFTLFTFAFAYGQKCGIGTNTIKIFPKDEIYFELFSLIPSNKPYDSQELKQWISKILPSKDLSEQNSCCYMTEINKKSSEKFLKTYKKGNFTDFEELSYLQNKYKGVSESSSITFKTVETLSYPSFLKVSSKKYGDFYFIGVFLGGCNRNGTFDLSRKSQTDLN